MTTSHPLPGLAEDGMASSASQHAPLNIGSDPLASHASQSLDDRAAFGWDAARPRHPGVNGRRGYTMLSCFCQRCSQSASASGGIDGSLNVRHACILHV
ncbi:MAG: hypothetical protein RJA63_2775 [Pseudomonadota bacterium]|jgi:hypothetical protein